MIEINLEAKQPFVRCRPAMTPVQLMRVWA
jgi:hypothetical protein